MSPFFQGECLNRSWLPVLQTDGVPFAVPVLLGSSRTFEGNSANRPFAKPLFSFSVASTGTATGALAQRLNTEMSLILHTVGHKYPPHHSPRFLRLSLLLDCPAHALYAGGGAVVLSHLEAVVQAGCLPGFLALVRSPDQEAARLGVQFVEVVLRALPNGKGVKLVEEADGIDALESLQFHGNDELRSMANNLVDRYYGENYGMEEEGLDEGPKAIQPDLPAWRNPSGMRT